MTLEAQQDPYGVITRRTLSGYIGEADPAVRFMRICKEFVKEHPEFKQHVVLFYHVEPIPATA